MEKRNIFYVPKKPKTDEYIEELLKDKNVIIEKIVSYGIPSPKDFWYEEDFAEWVIVLEGTATIKYFNEKIVKLKKGDKLHIPGRMKHRVEEVSTPCIWLAIKY